MAFGRDSVRGDGFLRIHDALAVLVKEPQQLEYERSRFDRLPPVYLSDTSGTTTRSPTPEDDEKRRDRRKMLDRLVEEQTASYARAQFEQQTGEEYFRLKEMHTNGICVIRVGESISGIADNIVKERWIEQGVWHDKWTPLTIGRWKHEEPLDIESDCETDLEALLPPFPVQQPQPRCLKSESARRQIAERRAVRERERESSRPYYQFVYHLSKEVERLQREAVEPEGKTIYDINTKAYENLKETWLKRRI